MKNLEETCKGERVNIIGEHHLCYLPVNEHYCKFEGEKAIPITIDNKVLYFMECKYDKNRQEHKRG